ncbi:hypothetical protein D3C86_2107600 [compost metagenome]
MLIDDELRSGRMRRVDGPSLPGFTYHLIEDTRSVPRRSLVLFRDWLLDEARSFRETTRDDLAGQQMALTS